MYTMDGIQGYTDPKRLIPWDDVRRVRIAGQPVVRHVLTIRPEHGRFIAPGVGHVRRTDLGRVLVADLYPDGHWIDAFALPGQKVLSKDRDLAEVDGKGVYVVEGLTGQHVGFQEADNDVEAIRRMAQRKGLTRSTLRAHRV